MDKLKLKEALLQMEFSSIKNIEEVFHSYMDDAEAITGETKDYDEIAQNFEQAEMTEEIEDQIQDHEEHIQTINSINFSSSEEVEIGSVVKLNGKYMVVAVPKTSFEFEGTKMLGISSKAPVFQLMKGKKAGTKFEYNNRKFKIEEVH